MKCLRLLGLLLLTTTVSYAQERAVRVIPLQYADATVLAGMLGGVAATRAQTQTPEMFARESITQDARRLPGTEGKWQRHVLGQNLPDSSGGSMLRLPDGLSQSPVAMPAQNALLVQGTPEAVDQLAEMIRLLDRPTPMINIEMKLVDAPEEAAEERGIDFQAVGSGVSGGTSGNVPGSGAQLRWGLANQEALAGWDIRQSASHTTTGTEVTTFNNQPAEVGFGEDLPFFVSSVSYDAFGNRQVTVDPYSIFIGINLFVHPRISGRDTVTMRLVPTLVEAAGMVAAPDGSAIPVTQSILADTQVRVKDGESIVIAGMGHLADSVTDRFRTLLGTKMIRRSSHPMLIVTPHIIRPTMTDAGVVH
jgi:type II secretory pathway component GspD/PulD (secretin)